MSTAGKNGAHILLCPISPSGHIIPLLELAHKLLSRRFVLTILITPPDLPLLEPLLSAHPPSSLQPLILSPPQSSGGDTGALAKIRSMSELHDPILHWFRSHPSPPVAIVSDIFLGWTLQLASELGVPRVVFSPSGSFSLLVFYFLWRDLPKNEDSGNPNFEISFPAIPNSPAYPWRQLSHIYRCYNEGDPTWQLFRNCALANLTSWGVLFNSFAKLEGVYLDYTKQVMGHDRVWAVGPSLPPENDQMGLAERGGSSSVPCHDLISWLDKLADDSSVYVCFGSRHVLSRRQMDELAAGLERSGVNFIWCVREPDSGEASDDDYGVIPDGYEDRVGGRGILIRGWAPQVAILRHRAVGAFLTHCGWNSTLEGIAAGVVMLTWPMCADQYINANLLVDGVGVGIRVGEDTSIIPESGELARILSESVDGSKAERVRAAELRDAALGAVNGGSSDRDLEEFAKTMRRLQTQTQF